jgi:hypothetical protein
MQGMLAHVGDVGLCELVHLLRIVKPGDIVTDGLGEGGGFNFDPEPVCVQSCVVDVVFDFGLDDLFGREFLAPACAVQDDFVIGAVTAEFSNTIGIAWVFADPEDVACGFVDDGEPVGGFAAIVKYYVLIHRSIKISLIPRGCYSRGWQ